MSVYTTMINGLMAQQKVLGAHAQNIANMHSTGTVSGGKNAYIPVDPVQISGGNGGGPRVELRPVDPPGYTVYAPPSAVSDKDGLVTVPNISLDDQLIGTMQASHAYKANLAAIRTQDDMDKALLDILG